MNSEKSAVYFALAWLFYHSDSGVMGIVFFWISLFIAVLSEVLAILTWYKLYLEYKLEKIRAKKLKQEMKDLRFPK